MQMPVNSHVLQAVIFVHGHGHATWHSQSTEQAIRDLRWDVTPTYASINRVGPGHYWG